MHKDLRESILILRAEREAMLESLSTLQDEHKAISLAWDESFQSRDEQLNTLKMTKLEQENIQIAVQYETATIILQHEQVIEQYETRISQTDIEYDKVKCHYENEVEQLSKELDRLKVELEATNDLRRNRPLVSQIIWCKYY